MLRAKLSLWSAKIFSLSHCLPNVSFLAALIYANSLQAPHTTKVRLESRRSQAMINNASIGRLEFHHTEIIVTRAGV